MPRLIDANEILKSEHQHYDYMSDEYYVLVRDIENALTVDTEPVRHGHWIDCKGSNGKDYRKCSECLHMQDITGLLNYCPICGATMDEAPQREEPEINPCRGCEDYDGHGGCLSKGGCGERKEDAKIN